MSGDEERARLARHIKQARALADQARSLGLSDDADAIDSAAWGYQDAWRKVEAAEADLGVFLVNTAGITYRSKDREERALSSKVVAARRDMLATFHSLEVAGERYLEVARRLAAEAEPDPPDGEPARRGGPIPDADPRARIVDGVIAGREPDEDAVGASAPSAEAEPVLPGGLSWPKIEATYRVLAGEASPRLPKFRRLRANKPTRPETAHALDVSAATLKRACVAAEKGAHWPPAGL